MAAWGSTAWQENLRILLHPTGFRDLQCDRNILSAEALEIPK